MGLFAANYHELIFQPKDLLLLREREKERLDDNCCLQIIKKKYVVKHLNNSIIENIIQISVGFPKIGNQPLPNVLKSGTQLFLI